MQGNIFVALYLFAVYMHSRDPSQPQQQINPYQYIPHMMNFFKCLNENQIKPNEFMEKLKMNDTDVRCTLACSFEKDDIMKNNVLDADQVLKHTGNVVESPDQDKVEKIVRTCVAEGNNLANRCEKANEAALCALKQFQYLKAKKYFINKNMTPKLST